MTACKLLLLLLPDLLCTEALLLLAWGMHLSSLQRAALIDMLWASMLSYTTVLMCLEAH